MKAKRGVICALAALGVLLTMVAFGARWDTARAAGTFNPTITATVSDPTAGAHADIVRDFEVPAGDYNYEVSIDLTPTDFAMSTDIPLGAWVGSLESVSTLGLLNNLCQTTLPVTFQLLNATLDTSSTVTFEDSYATDTDGLPMGVNKYPEFLNTLFPGLTPVGRLFGATQAAGTPVTMNIVMLAPGTTMPASFGGTTFDASLGRIAVSVLNNPAAMLAPNPITDFCAPLSAKTTLFGTTKTDASITPVEGGTVEMTNPTTPGDYIFTTYNLSMRDADADGAENYKDTCPYDVDTGVDDDKDGIDNVCDPTPSENTNASDHDSDLYLNRGDLCPLVANGPPQKDVAGVGNQLDTDQDDIGDACDQNVTTPDGEAVEASPTSTITITGGAAAETPTVAPAETPTVIAPPPTTATAVATPKPTPTAAATPSPAPPIVGGAGLLGSDGGFPVWAVYFIAVAAVLMLGGIGTVTTVVWRRRQ
jgi:hypothetical protein